MAPLETEANPNIRIGPLRWGKPVLCEGKIDLFKLLKDNCDA